jgi:hypothetical protein
MRERSVRVALCCTEEDERHDRGGPRSDRGDHAERADLPSPPQPMRDAARSATRPVPGRSGLVPVGWDAAGLVLAPAEPDGPGGEKPRSNAEVRHETG